MNKKNKKGFGIPIAIFIAGMLSILTVGLVNFMYAGRMQDTTIRIENDRQIAYLEANNIFKKHAVDSMDAAAWNTFIDGLSARYTWGVYQKTGTKIYALTSTPKADQTLAFVSIYDFDADKQIAYQTHKIYDWNFSNEGLENPVWVDKLSS